MWANPTIGPRAICPSLEVFGVSTENKGKFFAISSAVPAARESFSCFLISLTRLLDLVVSFFAVVAALAIDEAVED